MAKRYKIYYTESRQKLFLINIFENICIIVFRYRFMILSLPAQQTLKLYNMIRDFFLGFIKIHILHHASKEPVYGLWLIEELGHHGYKLSPGTLYPILHKLEEERLLKSYSENIGGKIRKYYKTTTKGIKTLSKVKDKIHELVEEVME